MSIGSIPCSFMERAWSGLSRRARMPPWTLGWSVFTRPSIISGKPVNSETSFTTTPFSLRSCAVPPVERISTPWVRSAFAKSTTPALSLTESSARWIFFILTAGSPRKSRNTRKPRLLRAFRVFRGSTPSVQAVLLELLPQGIPVQAQQLRGSRLVALGLEHHHLEHWLLDRRDHHVVDARGLLAVEVLEVLAHHLAHRRRQLVIAHVPSPLAPGPMLQGRPLRRTRGAPSGR